jgi:hypothetical protein
MDDTIVHIKLALIKVRDYTHAFVAQRVQQKSFKFPFLYEGEGEYVYAVIRGDGTMYLYQEHEIVWKKDICDADITTPYPVIQIKYYE